MSWHSKETESYLDNQPIEGMFFRDGDVLAQVWDYPWLKGMKSAAMQFPSGLEREVWGLDYPLVALFDSLSLPLFETRDEALITALEWNEGGYFSVFKCGENRLELWDHNTETIYYVTYDNQTGRMADVAISVPQL